MEGQKHERLKIISYEGHGMYFCNCDCGKETIKNGSDIRRGRIKSCGCMLNEKNSFDLIGKKINRLTILIELGKNKKGKTEFLCQCDCGEFKAYEGRQLKSGEIKTCGNHLVEFIKSANITHGDTGTRIYRIHANMLQRCGNSNDKNFSDYGGRGISVCTEWSGDNGYTIFKKWALDNKYDDSLSIDRVDVNGDYEPNNCRWASNEAQQRNKRNTKFYTYDNKTQSLIEWAEEYDLNYNSLWKRMNKYSYNIEKALTYNIEKIKKLY